MRAIVKIKLSFYSEREREKISCYVRTANNQLFIIIFFFTFCCVKNAFIHIKLDDSLSSRARQQDGSEI